MLLELTAMNLLALGLITYHAFLVKNYQLFPAYMYLTTGDSQAGLVPYSTSLQAQQRFKSISSSGAISITVGGSDTGDDGTSSYSAPVAHIFSTIILSSMLLGIVHLWRVLVWIFFGTLRLIEWEHLYEWSWLSATECFLAMTIFRDELNSKFMLCFMAVMSVKGFHWIAKDRVEYMEQTNALKKSFYIRITAAVALMAVVDTVVLYRMICFTIENGPSMVLLFANEFALMLIGLVSLALRFSFNTFEHRQGHPWDEKSQVLLHTDLVLDALRLVIYTFFFIVVMIYYGLPLHLIRDLYVTAASFVKRLQDVARYHKAVGKLDSLYPTLVGHEIEELHEGTCIICREELTTEGQAGNRVKQLPCMHAFHFKCLKSWLERQQACPTCRRDLLQGQPQQPTINIMAGVEMRVGEEEPLINWRRILHWDQGQQHNAVNPNPNANAANPRPRNPLLLHEGGNPGFPGTESATIRQLNRVVSDLQEQVDQLKRLQERALSGSGTELGPVCPVEVMSDQPGQQERGEQEESEQDTETTSAVEQQHHRYTAGNDRPPVNPSGEPGARPANPAEAYTFFDGINDQ